MKARAEIAVVMACYNVSDEEIAWTLDSLRGQTVPFKLFVVDDGSTRKPDYHAHLRGFNYELIDLPENAGVCTVRNPSIKRAIEEGYDFIGIIDCGDWAYPDRLEKQLAFMKRHPDIYIVGAASRTLSHDMGLAYVFNPPTDPDEIVKSAYYGLPFRHPVMMLRTGLFRQIGLYSGEFDAAEDYELVRRTLKRFRTANLPDVLLDKVLHAHSVSVTRRNIQLLNRLRIQWRYRDLTELHCYLGMLKTLAVLALPTRLVAKLQTLLYNRAAGRNKTASGSAGRSHPVGKG